MGDTTGIAWTDSTFNPWMGCTKVSEACTHCYAERDTKRYGLVEWGPDAARRRTSAENWKKPRRWDREAEAEGKRTKVFCASFADVFEERQELDPYRADLWKLIQDCPHLDWQLLTKRPQHVLTMVPQAWAVGGWPAHVWMGASVETQKRADERCDHLIEIGFAGCKVLFVSCEPLLGDLNLMKWLEPFKDLTPDLKKTPRINWVITGGESGTGFRVPEEAWVRSLFEQTRRAGAAFFYKQGSGVRPEKEPMLDGVRYTEFPVSAVPPASLFS